MENWSTQYSKYIEKEINDKWATFNEHRDNQLKINTLIRYAKEDNLELYNKLFPSIEKLTHPNELFSETMNTRAIGKHFKSIYGNKWIYQKGKL